MHRTIETSLGQLMDRYLDGDTRAFRELYDTLRPRLRRQMSVYIGDRAALDDLVQLVFMHAHLKRHTFEWPDGDRNRAVMAWYAAIARNRAIDALRERSRLQNRTANIQEDLAAELASTPAGSVADHEDALLDYEARQLAVQRIRRAIEKLPPTQREVVELHKLRGLSMDQIAERTGVRPGTLRVRAHRAYRSLANLLSTPSGELTPELAA